MRRIVDALEDWIRPHVRSIFDDSSMGALYDIALDSEIRAGGVGLVEPFAKTIAATIIAVAGGYNGVNFGCMFFDPWWDERESEEEERPEITWSVSTCCDPNHLF